MNLLLDTHVLLWCLDDHPFEPKAKKAIIDGSNQVFVSSASIWEITIKKKLGKLSAPDNIMPELERLRFTELPIHIRHIEYVGKLPDYHKDPFDRILIAQAISEKLTLITHDEHIKQYDVGYIDA